MLTAPSTRAGLVAPILLALAGCATGGASEGESSGGEYDVGFSGDGEKATYSVVGGHLGDSCRSRRGDFQLGMRRP